MQTNTYHKMEKITDQMKEFEEKVCREYNVDTNEKLGDVTFENNPDYIDLEKLVKDCINNIVDNKYLDVFNHNGVIIFEIYCLGCIRFHKDTFVVSNGVVSEGDTYHMKEGSDLYDFAVQKFLQISRLKKPSKNTLDILGYGKQTR